MFGKRSAQRTDDPTIEGTTPAYAIPVVEAAAETAIDFTDMMPLNFADPAALSASPSLAADSARPQPSITSDLQQRLLDTLFEAIDISRFALLGKDEARRQIGEIVAEVIALKGLRLSVSEQKVLVKSLCDDVLGFGPLEPLLARDDIGDIMVNSIGRVFIEVKGRVEETAIRFRDDRQLLRICQRLATQTGRHVDQASPICDARLPDGSRVNIILPPLAVKGPALTIRKFKRDRLRLRDLVEFGSVSPAGARLLSIIAACQCNVIISGGTGSGKTTLLNCLTAFINPRERIITCEDTAELCLQQPHVVSLETRPAAYAARADHCGRSARR